MSFKPKHGEPYWMLNSRFEVKRSTNTGSNKAYSRIAAGNCFRTEVEAQYFQLKVQEFLGRKTPLRYTYKISNCKCWWCTLKTKLGFNR